MTPDNEHLCQRVIAVMLPREGRGAVTEINRHIRRQLQAQPQDETLMSGFFDQLNARSLAELGRPAQVLSDARLASLLRLISEATEPGAHFAFHLLRQWVLAAFYLSPEGAKLLAYHPPIEGGYPDYGDPIEAECDVL